MKRVHLVRHGRTASNDARRAMGWSDEGLLPTWRPAAEAVAEVFAARSVDLLVSSPLARAVQTAEPLATRLGRAPVIDERFGELRVGPWQGYTEDEIARRWPEEWAIWRDAPHTLELVGRETLAELNDRVAGGLGDLFGSLAPGGTAVVFTHDAVIRGAVAWALETGPAIYRHVRVSNCSITTVALVGDRRELVRSNDVCHLAPVFVDE